MLHITRYAECADAIKHGAIKRISVSHERLVDKGLGHSEEKLNVEPEIYANPTILFRKKSRLLELDGGGEGEKEAGKQGTSPEQRKSVVKTHKKGSKGNVKSFFYVGHLVLCISWVGQSSNFSSHLNIY